MTNLTEPSRKHCEASRIIPESFARYEFVPSRRWRNLRRAIVKRFKFVIVFDVRESDVLIHAGYQASRDPKYWLQRLRQ